jgi:hypothetical protein
MPAASVAAGPAIEESWVSNVGSGGATLSMQVDPAGGSITYYFEYLTDAAYQANPEGDRFAGAAKTTTGSISFSGPREVSLAVGGLKPDTAYRFRPVAVGSGGTTVGAGDLVHIFVTKKLGEGSKLPDGRAWEMVSPVDKNGGDIASPEELFGGGVFQAGDDGLVTYSSGSSFGTAAGAPPVSQYLSRRTASGWLTENISTPLASGAYGDDPDGAPYRVFSLDLARGLLFGGLACRGGLVGCPETNPPLPGSGAPPGYMAYYLRDSATGTLASLLDAGDVGESDVLPESFTVTLAGATPGLSHVVLSSCAALTSNSIEVPDGPGHCDEASPNLYEWSAGGLKAINVRPGEGVTTPGATLAAPIGAISGDGVRVYWRDGAGLYLHDEDESVKLEAPAGGETFETATPDGVVAFFTSADDHLFRYVASDESVTDLTPGGGVVGVLGASASGDRVYFQDAIGLKLWRAGAGETTIVPGANVALPDNYPPATGTARVTADGRHLAFLSEAELTGFDNIDAHTKLRDAQLYRYGPLGGSDDPELVCASCDPTGARPTGPTSIPGSLVNGSTRAYRPWVLSADGSHLFFEVAVATKPGQTRTHVFQWQAPGTGGCARPFGCRAQLSGGGAAASLIDASPVGSDVYFTTGESLVRADPGAIDLYDARVGGGIPEPPDPPHCLGDNCQHLPGEPDDPTPGTLIPNPGNPQLRVFGPKKKPRLKRRKHRRHRHENGRKHASGRDSGGSRR